MLICCAVIIPFISALTFSILFTLVFVIFGIFLLLRWFSILTNDDEHFNIGDMKVPTFYATAKVGDGMKLLSMPVFGAVFGGIHCAGWFFNFPSSDEAILWRVSSAVLTGIIFLFPIFLLFLSFIKFEVDSSGMYIGWRYFIAIGFLAIILLSYIVSRLLLLVEAFISLRHLTPGMLALVKWTSFIPHI